MLRELNDTISGLTSLDTTIANESSVTAFRTEAANIFSLYRVYALVLPQVHMVRASDELSSVVVPELKKVQVALQSRIGADTASTAAAMSDLATQITAIQSDTSGVPATLLALTPAQWNADHTMEMGPRRQLGAARTAAGEALSDVTSVRAALT